FFLFFFSSRRRHTRFSRDWSSDVCSSDLRDSAACLLGCLYLSRRRQPGRRAGGGRQGDVRAQAAPQEGHRKLIRISGPVRAGGRSEERRVGKEGRSREEAEH